MGGYNDLKTAITALIHTNDNQEITGATLQSALLSIINTISQGSVFKGVATTSTNPGSPDANVFYIAGRPGYYPNFNLELTAGLHVIENKSGTWVNTEIVLDVIDAINIGGAKHVKPSQAMMIALQSVEQISDSEGHNNAMWWSTDGNLKYKQNDTVYNLGAPAYVLYYCGDQIYKWTGSGFREIGGGGTFASGEAVSNMSIFDDGSDTEGKSSAQLAAMIPSGEVIKSILEIISSIDTSGGSYDGVDLITTFSYDAPTRVITVKQSGRQAKTILLPLANSTNAGLMSSEDKVKLDSLHNLIGKTVSSFSTSTNENGITITLMTRDGTPYTVLIPNIDPSVLASKADKHVDANILTPSQWPRVMLYNIESMWGAGGTPPDYASIPVGSIYLDDSSDLPHRRLFYKKTIEGIYQRIDLGAPQENTIYCHIATGKLYRWIPTQNGNDGTFQQLGNGQDGITPHIGQNGNWWVGPETDSENDTGIKARGDNAPAPYIGENGNWYVAGNDTGVKAQGEKGDTVVVTDGQTFEFANNLNDESTSKGLTAAMGKRLGDAVFDNAILNVDYRDVQKSNVYIEGTKWAVDSKSRYQGKFVDVTNYKGWAFKIGGVWIPSGNNGYWWLRFAMVTSNSFSNGGDIPFVNVAPYNAKVENSTSEWHEGIIPSIEGNIYLYIYCYNSTGNPVDFPPELYVTDPNPTSRIERLEDLTDGVDEIKDGWFAISGEPYSYSIKATNCWPDQGIDADSSTLGATLVNQSYTHNFRCFPKSASINAAAATPSDCFSVAELPNKTLTLTFAEVEPVGTTYWAFRLALYNVSLQCLSVSGWNYIGPNDNYQKVINIGSTSPNAAYFKLIVSRSTAYQNWNYNDGDISFIKQVPSQESMPDRVAALEEKVANAAKDTIRILQYNIGHFAMGMNNSTYIGVDNQTTQTYPQFFDYDTQLKRWKSKIQNVAADVMFFEEYSTVFGKNNGVDVPTVSCGIFDDYPYISVGQYNTSTWWVHALISKFPLIGTATDVGLTPDGMNNAQGNALGYLAYMRVATININGTPVKVAATHLHYSGGDGSAAARTAEIKNIIKYFQNDEHVIVCGDFNTDKGSGASAESLGDYHEGAAEFDPFLYGFTEEGVTYAGSYTLANHGVLGDIPTYPASGSRPDRANRPQVPYCYLDNVLTKGFRMSNVIVIDDGTLTDHCGIMCDLTLID